MKAGRDAEKDLAMCEATTPGPWELEPEEEEDEGLVIWRKVEEHPGRLEGVIVLHPDCHYEKADVDFITEAREALPYWINRAQAAEAEIERLKAENVRVVAASGAGYEKLLEALREIDTHIRATADPVPYIVATLKQALPEYKGWDDASRT